ncbi:uncharacterized protein [Periplaneta americana]|uniref:uncharacterized protein isoform X2 n=1 Tax=Periplaneta americana TaxID=6978 RepID=UPI0037E7A68E
MQSQVTCAYRECENNRSNSTSLCFFKIPKEKERCDLWLRMMGREDLLCKPPSLLHNNTRVCADHFSVTSFTSTLCTRLLRFAVPIDIKKIHSSKACKPSRKIARNLPSKSSKLATKAATRAHYFQQVSKQGSHQRSHQHRLNQA